MHKVIAIISEDQAMGEIIRRYQAGMESLEDRKRFISKQIKDVDTAKRKIDEEAVSSIVHRLGAMGKMPKDWNINQDQIHIDTARDCVLWHRCDKECREHPGLMQIIQQIIPPPDAD